MLERGEVDAFQEHIPCHMVSVISWVKRKIEVREGQVSDGRIIDSVNGPLAKRGRDKHGRMDMKYR